MPLIAAHRAVFIHIPKTGGTSVAAAFGLREDFEDGTRVLYGRDPATGEMWLHHLGVQALLDTGRLKGYENWYRFAFVRNPWTRCRSSWLFQKSRGFLVADTLTEHVRYLDQQFRFGGELFITDVPQYRFVYGKGDTLLVDSLGRFEHMQETFQAICLRLGATPAKLPFLNQTPLPPELWEAARYTQESVEKVGRLYREDCARFGYDADGIAPEESESVFLPVS